MLFNEDLLNELTKSGEPELVHIRGQVQDRSTIIEKYPIRNVFYNKRHLSGGYNGWEYNEIGVDSTINNLTIVFHEVLYGGEYFKHTTLYNVLTFTTKIKDEGDGYKIVELFARLKVQDPNELSEKLEFNLKQTANMQVEIPLKQFKFPCEYDSELLFDEKYGIGDPVSIYRKAMSVLIKNDEFYKYLITRDLKNASIQIPKSRVHSGTQNDNGIAAQL